MNTPIYRYSKDGTAYIRVDIAKKAFAPKRRIEFTKIFVGIITALCVCGIIANYVLAFAEKSNVNSEVTTELIKTVLGSVLGYLLKAGFENVFKIRKNKI